jgi:biotin operon repressor
MSTQKRFPGDTNLETPTFLLNKNLDGELYAIFQAYSRPNEDKQTVVYKNELPTLEELAQKLGMKSRHTVSAHRDKLIESGYIIDDKENKQYILPNQEEIFFMIPLDTLRFITNCLQEHVVKTYIYLGQRWKYKGSEYLFTIKEIAEHLGIKLDNHSRNYRQINDVLLCLNKMGLVDWVDIWVTGEKGVKIPYKRLTYFSVECPKKESIK